MRGYKIALRGPDGSEHRRVDFSRDRNEAPPKVGDSLSGTLSPHPKGWEGVELFKEGTTSTSPAGGAGGSRDERGERIERQVAVKSATRLVSAWIAAGKIEKEDAAIAAVGAFTDDVLAIIREEKKAEPSTEGTDADIPF